MFASISIELSGYIINSWSISLIIMLVGTNIKLDTVFFNQIHIIFQYDVILIALSISIITAVNRVVAVNNNPWSFIFIFICFDDIVFKCSQ